MNSCEDASFDLFSRPLTETGLQDVHEEEIMPNSAITSNTLEFTVSGDGEQYVDLSETRLHLRVKISSLDATATEILDDQIELVRYWPQAMFKQLDLYLNGTLITNSSGMYNFLAYISSQLSFSSTVRDNQMSVLEHSLGWKVKKGYTEAESLSRLHLPMFNQQRLLPNGVKIYLRFIRSADDFVIMTKDDKKKYKIEITHASLFIRRISPTPTLLIDHAMIWNKSNAVYPIVRIWSKFMTLAKGIKEFHLPNVVQGQLPSRIIVGIVKSSDFSGTATTDPFKFAHFNLEYISLQCNGRALPSVPITANFSKNQCLRAYESLLETAQGPCVDQESIGINLEEYRNRSCFYGFKLSRSLNGQHASLPPRDTGYVNAKLIFEKVLEDNCNIIWFLEFNNSIEIDATRSVYIDFA